MPDLRDNAVHVTFVCTGNRARSPLAEALFRRYAVDFESVVTSFGTMDVGPLPALPEAIAAAARLGVDLSGHRARPLRRSTLDSADLVLGFEPFHVTTAVIDGGANRMRAFLLPELVELLGSGPEDDIPGDPLSAIALADARRRYGRLGATRSVADPLGQPADAVARIAADVDRLVRQLVHGLSRRATAGERGTQAIPNIG